MVFKKELMIKRLTEEGRADMIDDTVLAIMDNLDGQTASPVNWERVVNEQPFYWVVGKDGVGNYVNENDCI